MKIRLEQGAYAGMLLGLGLYGVLGFYILMAAFAPPFNWFLLFLSVGFFYIGIFFLKLPLLVITYDSKREVLKIPFWRAYDDVWDGQPNGFIKFLFPLFYYRKKIPRAQINYVLMGHYDFIARTAPSLNDEKASNKLSKILNPMLAASPAQVVVTGSSIGVGNAIGSGNIGDVAGGVVGGVAGALVAADALKNNYMIAVRTPSELIVSNIGYERRREDCEAFAKFLAQHDIKVISAHGS